MTATSPADHLGTAHEQAVVRPQLDRGGHSRLGEARPAGAGHELGVGPEQLRPAAGAAVRAVRVVVHVLTGERALGVRLAEHPVLLLSQLRTPLLVGLLHLGGRDGVGLGLTHVMRSLLVAYTMLDPLQRKTIALRVR